jgi:cytochrome c553
MARLSPFVRRHLGVHGTYSFVLPDLAPGAIRMGNQVKAAKTQAWRLQVAPARHQAVAACATCPDAGGRSGGVTSPMRAVQSVRRCTR